MSENGRSMRILVAEDEDIDRDALCRALREEFGEASVIEAPTAAEAREQLLGGEVDVAILDEHLGDGRGSGLLRLAPEIQKFVLTGHSSEESVLAALRGGAVDFLNKDTEGLYIGELLDRLWTAEIEVQRRRRAEVEERARRSASRDLEGFTNQLLTTLNAPLETVVLMASNLSKVAERHSDPTILTYSQHLASGAGRLQRFVKMLGVYQRANQDTEPKAWMNPADILASIVRVYRKRVAVELEGDPLEVWCRPASLRLILRLTLDHAGCVLEPDTPVVQRMQAIDNGLRHELEGQLMADALVDPVKSFDLFQAAMGPRSEEPAPPSLAAVRRVAELHGGSADIEPREDGRMAYVLFFPNP